jgi:outer membrane protein, heavy metal efflux system
VVPGGGAAAGGPAAESTLKMFKQGGDGVDVLKPLQNRRAVTGAGLEYNTSLGRAWRAAAEPSGLLLEEAWPGPVAAPETRPEGPTPK